MGHYRKETGGWLQMIHSFTVLFYHFQQSTSFMHQLSLLNILQIHVGSTMSTILLLLLYGIHNAFLRNYFSSSSYVSCKWTLMIHIYLQRFPFSGVSCSCSFIDQILFIGSTLKCQFKCTVVHMAGKGPDETSMYLKVETDVNMMSGLR